MPTNSRRKTATRAGARRNTGGGTARRTGSTALATRPVGGVALASTVLPAGALTAPQAGLEADITAELSAAGPAFGDVLASIGTAVARSQAALDAGMVETARELSATTITVVTDVIQKLDDDGQPVGDDTELITANLSLINFVSPTVHEWNHVAISMDLEVGEFDAEQGMRFTRSQSRVATSTVRPGGLLGLFGVSFSSTVSSSGFASGSARSDFDADWATGQLRLDAELTPRRTGKFPVPAEVTIGPSLFFAQGAVTETKQQGRVVSRSMDLVVTARKADGTANPNVPIVLEANAFRFSFASGAGFTGSQTNAQGQVKVTLTRDIPSDAFLRATTQRVTARLGQVSNSVLISL